MRFRLKKLLIQNFKGIEGSHMVEFGNSSTLLFGPNGYGKTTIFDALELLLTGRVLRIDRDNNERGSKTHETTVFHNNKNKSVVLKLLVQVNEDTEHVIVRTFPPSKSKLSLGSYIEELKTYLINDFNQQPNESDLSVDQSELEEKLLGSDGKYLSKYFRLLSYVPQSEVIHFLKMKQVDRYTELSPLLDMSNELTFNEDFTEYRKNLYKLKKFLEEKLEEYSGITGNEKVSKFKYFRITHNEEIPEYDEETPFKGLSISVAKEKRDRITKNLQELADFLNKFSPKEYFKEKKNNEIKKIASNSLFINYLVFQEIIKNKKFVDNLEGKNRIIYLVRNTNLPEKYIFQKYLQKESFDSLYEVNRLYKKYKSVLYDPDGNIKNTKQSLLTLSDEKNNFNTDTQKTSIKYLHQYETLEKNIGSSKKLLKEIQTYRKYITDHIKHETKEADCPLCGYRWPDNSALKSAINEKTSDIEKLMGQETRKLEKLDKAIQDEFFNGLRDKAATFLKENKNISEFFSSIQHLGSLSSEDRNNIKVLEENLPQIKQYIHKKQDVNKELKETKNSLIEFTISEIKSTPDDLLNEIRKIMSYDFSDTKNKLIKYGLKLSKSRLDKEKFSDFNLDKVKVQADDYIKEINKYLDDNSVKSNLIESQHLFIELFKEKEDLFKRAKKDLINKSKYIEQQFYISSIEKFNIYKKQYSEIKPISEKMYALSKDYEEAIRKYQFNITKPLKIPFYIYSAKILQNTPSGEGIFIKTEPKKNTVVFCTTPDTSHDALHQLSSGQLAVVSMAFNLSMNAVYSNKSLKLLVIDDPIQDMDVLNVHSLSELLRREFINDMQIIISTHSDLDMQYLKFMFDKATEKENIKAWNVQNLFYSNK